MFGAIGFVEFPDLFRFGRPDIVAGNALSPNNYAAECTTLWKCSVVVLDLGLRAKDLESSPQHFASKASELGLTFSNKAVLE